jgi:hypothetical protein
MTDRVRAGLRRRSRAGPRQRTPAGILEATLHLGHSKACGPPCTGGRENVHNGSDAKLKAAWKTLSLAPYEQPIVRAWRRREGLTDPSADGSWLTALIEQYADEGVSTSQLADVKATIRDALQTAAAEGRTGALAVSADQMDRVGFEFNVALNIAYEALAALTSCSATTRSASGWRRCWATRPRPPSRRDPRLLAAEARVGTTAHP